MQFHHLDPEHVSLFVSRSFPFDQHVDRFSPQIMVAEQMGLVRLVTWRSQTPFITLNAGMSPLSFAHWNPADQMRFGAVADGKWLLWNLSRRGVRVSFPERTGDAHADGSRLFRWSLVDSDIFATTSSRNLLKVCNSQRAHLPQPFPQRNRIADFSWQAGSSWVAATADCFLKLLK